MPAIVAGKLLMVAGKLAMVTTITAMVTGSTEVPATHGSEDIRSGGKTGKQSLVATMSTTMEICPRPANCKNLC